MLRIILLSILTTSLFTASAFGQRNDRFGGGRNGVPANEGFPFNRPSNNNPTTLRTVASSAPAPSAPAAAPAAPEAPEAESPNTPSSPPSDGSIASLIPPYGVTPGIELNDGTPRCAGDQGKPIDCDCPPPVDTLAAAVEDAIAAGSDFPTGSSAADQLARLNTCIVTLQSIKGAPGSGVGCPIVSTTWTALRTSLQAQG